MVTVAKLFFFLLLIKLYTKKYQETEYQERADMIL